MSKDTKQWTVKYRPTLFRDYLGNSDMVERVTRLMQRNKLPRTILLQGERGTGKTSMARLLAKNLLCEQRDNGNACDSCPTCQQINRELIQGGTEPKHIDVCHYNITQMNSVNDATTIVQRIKQRTLQQRERVFILDEIQRASKEAQSTLLQIAEDPPKGVTLIVCTTNPEQLLKPLRSRFTPIQVSKPSKNELEKYLMQICRQENVSYTKEAIRLVVHKLQGNPRECINMVQYLSESDDLTRKVVEKELQIVSQETYKDYLTACKQGNISEIMRVLEKENIRQEIQYDEFIQNLGEYLVELLEMKSYVKTDMYSVEEAQSLRNQYQDIGEEELLEILKLLRPYAHIPNATNYVLVTLAIEIMDIYKEKRKQYEEEYSEQSAKKTFNAVGRKIKEAQPKREVAEVQADDFEDIFGTQTVEIEGIN